jgi:MFS family permease
LPNFLTEKFSLGLAEAGFTASAYLNCASIGGLVLGGWAADRLQRLTKASRLWVLVAALAVGAPCLHWVGAGRTLPLTIFAAAGFGLSNGLYVSNMFASAFEIVAPERRATAAGFLNLIGAFVAGFSGLLGGLLKQTMGIDGLMTICGVACLGAALLLAFGIRSFFDQDSRRSRPHEFQEMMNGV